MRALRRLVVQSRGALHVAFLEGPVAVLSDVDQDACLWQHLWEEQGGGRGEVSTPERRPKQQPASSDVGRRLLRRQTALASAKSWRLFRGAMRTLQRTCVSASPPQSQEMILPLASSSAFGTRRCTGHAVGWSCRPPGPGMAGQEPTSVHTEEGETWSNDGLFRIGGVTRV